MKLTTLCYLEQDDKYLMLLRNKKKNDLNENKWIGTGGKFEANELPEECLVREVLEETGLTLHSYRFRGLVVFVSDRWETEYMYVYTSDSFSGEMINCPEGHLEWIEKSRIMELALWEGDRIFLQKMLDDEAVFSMRLEYAGDVLIKATQVTREGFGNLL